MGLALALDLLGHSYAEGCRPLHGDPWLLLLLEILTALAAVAALGAPAHKAAHAAAVPLAAAGKQRDGAVPGLQRAQPQGQGSSRYAASEAGRVQHWPL